MNDIFTERHSVRKYQNKKIPREILTKLMTAGIGAPSAGNCQPWHFYAVESDEVKTQLCEAAYGQKFVEEAPLVIVVCAESERSETRYKDRGRDLYCIQDTAAAVQNILLCAVSEGLGACWVGAFSEEAVGEVLKLPTKRRPVAILPVGYPKGSGKKTPRRPLREVLTVIE